MSKAIKYAFQGVLAGGIGNGILNIINQANRGDAPFNWGALLKAIGKGALIVGGASGLVGLGLDYVNSREEPIDTDAAIASILSQLRLSKQDRNYRLLKEKSDWLIAILKEEYGALLKGIPYCFGSTERGTALNEHFDIDICLSFKARSFSSTEEMFHTVLDYLQSKTGYNSISKVRAQKKSLGVFFDIAGQEFKVDILPHKLTGTTRNRSSGYLYVNPQGIFESPSWTKTDIQKQNRLSLSDTQKKLLTAMKAWKKKNDVPISSHLLQYLIIECYRCNRSKIPRMFTQKLIMIFTFIHESIGSISIISIENTNNVLTDIPLSDKNKIASACKTVLDEYEYQPNSIVQIIG